MTAPFCTWCKAPMEAWNGKCASCGEWQPIQRADRPAVDAAPSPPPPPPPPPPAAPVTAPAGWYPSGAGDQRYWDGSAWTDHRAPVNAGVPPAAKVEHGWAWALVAVPLVLALAPLAFPTLPQFTLLIAALVANGVFAKQDERRLAAAGVASPGWIIGVIFVPLYLWLRSRRVGQPLILVAWVVVFVGSIALLTRLGPVSIDSNAVEQAIEQDLESQTGGTGTDVSCPTSPSLQVNDTFTCDVTDDSGTSGTVLVTLTSRDGSYSWVLQ